MSEFKVGDRVFLAEHANFMPPIGSIAFITSIEKPPSAHEPPLVTVRWEHNNNYDWTKYFVTRFRPIELSTISCSVTVKPAKPVDPELYAWAKDVALSAMNHSPSLAARVKEAAARINRTLTATQLLLWRDACMAAKSATTVFTDFSQEYDAVVGMYNALYRNTPSPETKKEAGTRYLTVLRIACWLAYEEATEYATALSDSLKAPQQPKEPEVMSNALALSVSNITFITAPGFDRVDVTTLSAEDLGKIVQTVENEIKSLSDLTTKPKAVTARIVELQKGLADILAAADAAFDAKQ